MEKQITLKYIDLFMIILAVGIIIFFITRKISKAGTASAVAADAKNCECGAEYIMRTYAVQNKSAKQMYQDIYKTPAVNGKSALPTCPA